MPLFNPDFPLVSLNFFLKNREKLKKLVLVGGTFDVIHVGHVNYLKKAKSLGDTLIVQIAGGEKGVFSSRQRAIVVSAIRFVDFVFIYNGVYYDQEIIDKIKPDVILFSKQNYTDEIKKKVKSLQNLSAKIVTVK